MKKTVFVTGGQGFIGKRLTDALLQKGYKVRVASRRQPPHQPVNPDVSVVQVHYQEVASLQKAMQGCVAVYHLAAVLFGFQYSDFEEGNAQVTRNMVQAARQTPGLERFVYVSSLAASGYAADEARPRTEADEPRPVSDYGITKLAGEKAVQTLPPSIVWTIIRPPIVYGPHDSGVSKIALWVKRGLMVNTSGKGLFSFVYVDDLVQALASVLKTPGTENQIFFVCEKQDYPWPLFIGKMAHAMGVRKPFMPNAPKWMLHLAAAVYSLCARVSGAQPALNYDKVKEAVIDGHWTCSGQKWQALTGQHFTPLEQGLQKTFTRTKKEV